MYLKNAKLKDKKVLIRVDFNTPLTREGHVEEDTRIQKSIPTLQYLLDQSVSQIIIMTHLGRPKGENDEHLKTNVLAQCLEKLMNQKVFKANAVTPTHLPENEKIVMLENLRFDKREKQNSEEMAKSLAKLADIYVNDAFGVCHREHTSVVAITKELPSYMGLLLEKEMEILSEILENPKKPLTLILGGAKIETKIGIMQNFINKADNIIVGGAMANTFLYAQGYDVGESLYEADKKQLAQEIMLDCETHHEKFITPKDLIVASEASNNVTTLTLPVEDIEGDMKIFDIGPASLARYLGIIKNSQTVIWNGPIGLFEFLAFEMGTRVIAEALANSKAKTILGGGDTLNALRRFGIPEESYDHVSTGGGAMLAFLEGSKVPGIEALKKH